MKITFFFFLLILCSCAVNKNFEKDKQNKELLKQLAYCRCMDKSIEAFSKTDTSEVGSGAVRNLMDSYGLFTKMVEPILDSLAFTVVKRQMASKLDSVGKHESALGKTSYIFACLNFYRSKRLDSLVTLFPRDSYIVK